VIERELNKPVGDVISTPPYASR